jgi:tRNA threonylcarbamoyladenosine biosynthesis protein TsaB
MIILGIETATERLSTALLVEDKGILIEHHEDSRMTHCELLTKFILDLTEEAEVSVDDIGCIAVSTGPGSFTGLRIGISTAMGLAYGICVKTCGVNTLMGMAWKKRSNGSLVCPVIDAKRSEVYTGIYRMNDSGLPEIIHEACVIPVDKMADLVLKTGEPITLTGPDASKFGEMLKESLDGRLEVMSSKPSAEAIAEIGLKMFHENGGVSPIFLEPMYLRRSDAETARDRRCR